MAPGPWGGVGGGWGPRDGGWGRQLLAAGPRPGGGRADVRPKATEKKWGKAGWKPTGRGEHRAEGKRRGSDGLGLRDRTWGLWHRGCGLGIADFPNLPPAPRKRSGKCKRKRRGNPSLGQKPGRDTRYRNWRGGEEGEESLQNRPGSAPACTGTAQLAPHFKRGGASLSSPPHAAHPPHTPL